MQYDKVELLSGWSHHWNSVLSVITEAESYINIASFGIHLPPKRVAAALWQATQERIKVRMLIGRHAPYKSDMVTSILALRDLRDKLKNVTEMLPEVQIAVDNCHTKVIMNETCAIVGGRNLSFSTWPDLSFRFWRKGNRDSFDALEHEFSVQFAKAQPVRDFLTVTKEDLERTMEVLVEQAIERRIAAGNQSGSLIMAEMLRCDTGDGDNFDSFDLLYGDV